MCLGLLKICVLRLLCRKHICTNANLSLDLMGMSDVTCKCLLCSFIIATQLLLILQLRLGRKVTVKRF